MLINNILKYSKKINTVFKKLSEIGKKTKFTLRERKIKCDLFLKTIIQTHFQNIQPSLDDYSETYEIISGEVISRQGFDQRINKHTIDFMKEVLRSLMTITPKVFIQHPKLLLYFSCIRILDSTIVELNSKLKEYFKGFGGCASQAAIKLQHLYDPIKKESCYFELTEGTFSDNKYNSYCEKMLDCIESNSLLLFDLGYFSSNFLLELQNRAIYYLSRFPHSDIKVYLQSSPEIEIDILEMLKKCKNENMFELDVLITESKVPVRLLFTRVKQEIASQRINKKKKELQKKGRTMTDRMRVILEWSILITNVPKEVIKVKDAYKVYGIRWSIELCFKAFKSGLNFDYLAGINDPNRVLFEIYCKLICMVMLSIYNYVAILELPASLEISLFRTLSLYRKLVSEIVNSVLDVEKMSNVLSLYAKKVLKGCIVGRTGKRKSTIQSLNYNNKGGYHETRNFEFNLAEIMSRGNLQNSIVP